MMDIAHGNLWKKGVKGVVEVVKEKVIAVWIQTH